MKQMIRRYGWLAALAGGLAITGIIVTGINVGASPAAAPAATGLTLSTSMLANHTTATTPGGTRSTRAFGAGGFSSPGPWSFGGPGPGGFGGERFGGFGRGLSVKSVSGNTITATGRGGQTITVQVSATTAYTEAGAGATLSDVHAGSRIAVQGSFANTSGTTINATGITIVLPQVAGVVTNVNGSTLTLTSFDGAAHTVTVSGSTRYQKAGQGAALSDVTTGTALVAEGTLNGDGSLSALRVVIQVPRLAGQVTAVNGSSYTVTGRFGSTYTVATTSSTTFVNADGTSATASAVKTGVFIVAEGSLSSDGKTLTAQRVLIAPAGAGRGFGGFGRHGGFGHHGGDGDFGGPNGGLGGANGGTLGTTPGTTAPSTSGTQNI